MNSRQVWLFMTFERTSQLPWKIIKENVIKTTVVDANSVSSEIKTTISDEFNVLIIEIFHLNDTLRIRCLNLTMY